MSKVVKVNWQRVMIFLVGISFLIPLKVSASQTPASRTFTVKDGLTRGGVVCLSPDQGGYIWVVTRDEVGKSGVSVLNKEGGIFTYTEDNSEVSEKTHQVAFEPVEEKDFIDPSKGSIWFATTEGVRRLDRRGSWYIYNSQNSKLPGNQVSALTVDPEGNRWIATVGRGVSCWSKGGLWKVYTMKDGLCSDSISSILVGCGGYVWFGSRGQGISRRDREGKWQTFTETDSGLIDNTINTMVEDSEGRIWFATDKGLSVFDGKGWMSFTPFNSRIPDKPITAIAVDREGNRWIGTWGEGLCALRKNGEWQIYTNKNSGIKDNRISALLLDKENNLWIGSPSGLTLLPSEDVSSSAFREYAPDRLWDFGPPLSVSTPLPDEGIFTWGYTWTNREKEAKKVTLNIALPSTVYQRPLWSYVFLGVDEVSPIPSSPGLNYQVKKDNWGNQWIEVGGAFTKVSFLCRGLTQGSGKNPPIQKISYPFPKQFPRDVKDYLKNTTFIPGNDPELIELARSLIKEGSHGDMYLMAKDLVFSSLFRDIAFDYGQSQEVYSFLNSDGMIRIPKQVIEENKGVGYSKARLLACLARSLNIPSRLIQIRSKKVWCELWINGLGWLGAGVTFPVYDYVWSERLVFPRKIELSGEVVTSLSGEEGSLKGIEWYPDAEASISTDEEGSLTIADMIRKSSLFLIQPTFLKELPMKAKIEVAQGLYAFVVKEGSKEFFSIQDERGGEKGKWELKESKEVLQIEMEGKVSLTYTVKKVGEYTVLTPSQ